MMLRPSDIAPKAVIFNPESGTKHKVIFARDQIQFHNDGSAIVKLFGIKNDGDRAGFEVLVPNHEEPKLDPVKTVHDYVVRTLSQDNNAVFVSLNNPHTALNASTISNALEEAIDWLD